MSEGGEELQQENAINALRARSQSPLTSQNALRARSRQDNESYNETKCDEEYRTMCHRLETHLQDMTACDVQLSLFGAARTSYRQDSTLSPFPPMFLSGNDKDVEALRECWDRIPSLQSIKSQLQRGNFQLEKKVLELILWVLDGGNCNLKLRTLSEEERDQVVGLKDTCKDKQPHYVLEVTNNASQRWLEGVENKDHLWAFHGSRLDNFYSILHYGLQQHRSKTGLFGEGIYLCEDLGVSLTYSGQGLGWPRSGVGGLLSAVVLAMVVDTDPGVKRYSEDRDKGRVEGSIGGRVPDKYVVVRNNELLNIRYLLVYKHCSTNSGLTASGTHPLLAFINNNKMLLLHLTYIAMLALIGLSNSTFFQRLLRRMGWKD